MTKDAQNTEGEDDDDSEVCFICASPVDHHSTPPRANAPETAAATCTVRPVFRS